MSNELPLIGRYTACYPYRTFNGVQTYSSCNGLRFYGTTEIISYRKFLIGCSVSLEVRSYLDTLPRYIDRFRIVDVSSDGRRILLQGYNRWYSVKHFAVWHYQNKAPAKGFKKFAREYL